ncbi:MAG: lipocalin-like domain-containing protein [Prevotella sp.]|nr:lipocalin-like domain-containing protein [Prevotella sp.]
MERYSTKYTFLCKYTLILILLSALLYSCDTIESSGNGKLDGMWHLTSIDTLSTLGVNDMDQAKIYWSFESKLLELDDKSGANANILFRFKHSNGTLQLYDPYLYNRESGDTPINDVQLLYPFGVDSLETTYNVETLTSRRMVLSNTALRLHFHKI